MFMDSNNQLSPIHPGYYINDAIDNVKKYFKGNEKEKLEKLRIKILSSSLTIEKFYKLLQIFSYCHDLQGIEIMNGGYHIFYTQLKTRIDWTSNHLFISTGILVAEGGKKKVRFALDLKDPKNPHIWVRATPKKVIPSSEHDKDEAKALTEKFKADLEQEYSNYQKYLKGSEYFVKLDLFGIELVKNTPYFYMDFYDGGDLLNLIEKINVYIKLKKTFGEVEIKSLFQVIECILLGLKYLEDNSLYHRDLKPENIFIKFDDQKGIVAHMGDFSSLTKIEKDAVAQEVVVRKEAERIRVLSLHGTYDFISPEIGKGYVKFKEAEKKAEELVGNSNSLGQEKTESPTQLYQSAYDLLHNPKGDIWSIGLTLWELCCLDRGRLPTDLPKLEAENNCDFLFFSKSLAALEQDVIDQGLDLREEPCIQGLIQGMLRVNDEERFTASECLEYFYKIKQAEENFFFDRNNKFDIPFSDSELDSESDSE